MNIELPLKIRNNCVRLFFMLLYLFGLIATSFSQQSDSILIINQDPEKLLKNIRIGRIEDGFNFWQDNFSGHWAGVDFGFNSFLNKNYSGYNTEFMDNDISRSNSTYINLIQQSIGFQHNRNTLGFVTGLGLHLQSYRLDRNTTIYRLPNNRIEPRTLVFDENQKSKLSIISLCIPLLTEIQIPINHYENRLYFSGGIFLGFRLDSHTKIKYRIDRKKEKLKTPDNYSLNDFKYGIMLRSGYRWINVFATYDLNPLFKENKGPEITPFTFGVTLLQF